MRTTYYTATSLDGFIATEEHSLDWLLTRDIDENGPMNYGDFIARIGAIVMGANTYQWILDNDEGGWTYEQPCLVATHRTFPEQDGVRFESGDVARIHAAAVEAADGRDVWIVGGGELAARVADAGLLDEVIVSIAPVTLGSGAPLFPRRRELRLVELAVNGEFACARYDVVGSGSSDG